MSSDAEIPKHSSKIARAHYIESVIIVIVAAIAAFLTNHYESQIPTDFVSPIYVIIVLVAGYLIIRILSALIGQVVDPRLGVTRSHTLKNFFQIVAGILLLILALSLFGGNVTNWLIGAGFTGIVLGLAAQQILGNLFAGVALLSSRPFEIGDRVTLITSGYGSIWSTYTHENQVSGYTGVVQDMGIYHTRIRTDEGIPLVLPNSVVIGSLVMNHRRMRERTVRVRMDLEKSIEFNVFKDELSSLIKKTGNDMIERETLHVDIVDVGLATYQVVMWLWTKSAFEEPIKTVIIQNALEVQKKLKAQQQGRQSP